MTALALTAAMVAGMAAPAYAGTYYIDNNGGDITVTKDTDGTVYVKRSKKDYDPGSLGDKDEDGNVIIKGGTGTDITKNPDPGTSSSESGSTGGGSSEGGTSANSPTQSNLTTLNSEDDSDNEAEDKVYLGDTKGNASSTGGEENENQTGDTSGSEENKNQTDDTTGSEENENQPDDATGSESDTSGSENATGSGGSDTKADDTPSTGGEKNGPQPGGSPAPESQFTYTSAYSDEGTRNESTTALKTAADNFKAAAQNVIRIINKLVNNESTGKDNTLNVTLDNVNITAKNDAALSVEGAGDTKITLRGSNTLTNDLLHAGLEHNEKSEDGSYTGKLTITSGTDDNGNTGSLTATGGNGAAGIGSSDSNGAGTIEITGGDITAIGGNNAAGIGSGYNSNGTTTIKIDGSTIVKAQGGSGGDNSGGAGIGSGDIGGGYTGSSTTNITISGGTIVEAVGGNTGDGIGSGSGNRSNSTTVTINGGRIEKAQGGKGYSIFDGGDGIHSDDVLTISGTATIVSAIGGSGGSSIYSGGSGIYSGGQLFISDNATITNAKGGEGQTSGGDGIRSNGTLTISSNGKIEQATGGEATGTNGTGGDGIFGGIIKILAGTITKATGGSATGDSATGGHGTGGDGIHSRDELTIEGGKIEQATGGEVTSSYGTGGSGIRSDGTLTISGGEIQQATGGEATGSHGIGGSGIRGGSSNKIVEISGGTITKAKGGDGKASGGNAIRSDGDLKIEGGTIGSLTTDDNNNQIPDPTTGALGGNAAEGENGGHGIYSKGQLFISGSADITNAKGGDGKTSGGDGIHGDGSSNDFKLSIYSANITNATGGNGKRGGSGLFGKILEIISSDIRAIGGMATGEGDYTGGAGIVGSESLTIEGNTRVQATGGNADNGTGGSGIFSDGKLSIEGGTINATGGSGKSGGAGIASSGSYGDLTIFGSAKIRTAQGGTSTDGNGGSGISSGGILTIEGSANIGTAQGGASTNGTGGDGIHSGSVVKISGGAITNSTGGNATGENSTGGSGIGGSFVNVTGGTISAAGGSGKSGGAGIDGGIVSISNTNTPLDLTATAPDADNAIRSRDGKKLDEIIHLEENGKRGLVKLVENGVTRLFHNGVYTASLPGFSGSEPHPLGDWVITKKPTCTEPGERRHSCKVKDCVVTETEELPALGHQWSGWMPVEGGSREYRICAGCGAVEYRDVSHSSSDSTLSTGLRVLDPAQADILQNVQLVRLSQISDVLYIDVSHETASLQGVLSDLTGLRSERIETVVFSTERCTSTLSLSDVAALGADDTPFTLRHSGSTATFTVGGADHSALLR